LLKQSLRKRRVLAKARMVQRVSEAFHATLDKAWSPTLSLRSVQEAKSKPFMAKAGI
jgi:hypothetical protein